MSLDEKRIYQNREYKNRLILRGGRELARRNDVSMGICNNDFLFKNSYSFQRANSLGTALNNGCGHLRPETHNHGCFGLIVLVKP